MDDLNVPVLMQKAQFDPKQIRKENAMKIKPCTDDIISVIGIWPVIIIAEVIFLLSGERNAFFIAGIALLNVFVGVFTIRDLLYFLRTLDLDMEGCTFSIGKFRKRYAWSELTVQLCDARNFTFRDSDKWGPGLLICPRTANLSCKLAPMTYCRTKHPLSSVYLRFETAKDTRKNVTGKIIYGGYTVDREKILEYLSFLQCREDLEPCAHESVWQ